MTTKPKKPNKPMPLWHVSRLRKKPEFIVAVEAPTAEAAIDAALNERPDLEDQRWRLVAHQVR